MHVLRWFAWSSVHYTGWSALGRGKPTSHPAMAVALVAWVSRWRNFAGDLHRAWPREHSAPTPGVTCGVHGWGSTTRTRLRHRVARNSGACRACPDLAARLVPDPIFEHPRLVAIYDALDPDRSDLDVYAAIASELSARHVLDLGCGTGTFALQLADCGLAVTGVDPAASSLAVARAKPGAERVTWIPRRGDHCSSVGSRSSHP